MKGREDTLFLFLTYNRVIVYSTGESCEGKLKDTVRELQEESKNAYPLQVLYWNESTNGDQFNQLMIDDSVNPKNSFPVFESAIMEKALQQLKRCVCLLATNRTVPHHI